MTTSVERDLGKWPRLLVTGDTVTREQAAEIILRTTDIGYLHCNDREWNHTVAEILGITLDDIGYPDWKSTRDWNKEFKSLDLSYLTSSAISSSWLDGRHGWIGWDGVVATDGVSGLNSKWPSHAEIRGELGRIAQAFPYLRMIVQLLAEDDAEVVVGQWSVRDGSAIQLSTGDPVKPPAQLDVVTAVESIFMPGRERGCSAGHLRWAVQKTKESLAAAEAA